MMKSRMNVVWDNFLGISPIHVSLLKSIASVVFVISSLLYLAEPVLKGGTSGESHVVNSYLFICTGRQALSLQFCFELLPL